MHTKVSTSAFKTDPEGFLEREMLLNLSSISVEGTASHFIRMDTFLSAAEGVSWKYLGMAEGTSERTRERG